MDRSAKIFRMKAYKARVVDSLLQRKLEGTGAVLIEGPKWCGKTTTAEQVAQSVIYMAEPQKRDDNIAMARMDPRRILSGAHPRLIDEWQIAPVLWDAVRHDVDHAENLGRFILTGSSVPANEDEIKHSGTGRFSWLKMRPMSLWESEESSGEISLHELFSGADVQTASAKSFELEEIARIVCRGGWPQAISLPGNAALDQAYNYVDAVAKKDISRVDGTTRDEDRARRLMRSYARLQGTQASASVIREDLSTNEMTSIDNGTIYSYLNALKRLFVVEDMPAWNPNLRAKDSIRTSDARYFVDPSIAAAALEIGPEDLMNDLTTFSLLFETMAIRDLKVYADALGGTVRHYRDRHGLECDAVIHLRNGAYALIEIKLGGDKLLQAGTETLTKLARLIDSKKVRKPAFQMLLTAVGSFAYRRDDGILVCPLSALRP